ncbi:MAG: type III polyketide synthase [Cyclobacteriaceae bacterium]|jgi:alpha-pyrone synthase
MSYITALATASPPHRHSQQQIADFMIRAMKLDDTEARRLRALYRATGIDFRHSVLADYGRPADFSFYANTDNLEPFPSTRQRLEIYREHALKLSRQAAESCLEKVDRQDITNLIVVSCTGMYAPGLDIDLVKALGLNSHVQRVCINFMGCYAAFNAIRLADTICRAEPHARVLIVCVELCSIHFQKEATEDNLLANALFADGAAAVLVQNRPQPGLNLKPRSFFCDLAPAGEQHMAWTVGDLGFEMKLSSYVPDVIRQGIGQLTHRLLEQINLARNQIAYYAIHPGGKKIIESIEAELGLTAFDTQHSYDVLRQYGNMSSPTVLFVLQRVSRQLNGVDDGKNILSFAFGPGLTLESMVLEIENH